MSFLSSERPFISFITVGRHLSAKTGSVCTRGYLGAFFLTVKKVEAVAAVTGIEWAA